MYPCKKINERQSCLESLRRSHWDFAKWQYFIGFLYFVGGETWNWSSALLGWQLAWHLPSMAFKLSLSSIFEDPKCCWSTLNRTHWSDHPLASRQRSQTPQSSPLLSFLGREKVISKLTSPCLNLIPSSCTAIIIGVIIVTG